MALLYDLYVDEEIYYKKPTKYLFPPTVYLNSIEKDNGAEIPLGFFNDDSMREISAIIFSCNALWTKLTDRKRLLLFLTKQGVVPEQTHELVEDGLFIFHNPYAKYPLAKSIFRKNRVCQIYLNDGIEKIDETSDILYLQNGQELILEFSGKHMVSRVPL